MKLLQKQLQLLSKHEARLKQEGYTQIAGVDEAGRGPLAGPVVAAACSFTEPIAGLDDSKQLTPKKREALFDILTSKTRYGIGIVEHDVIDEINILQATHLAMRKAVASLPHTPDMILVDGRPVDFPTAPSLNVIKGDAQERLIAAASILAKVTRDRIMLRYHELYPEYDFASHKGYGTAKHRTALQAFGRSPIHRQTFRF